jgi:hypothetical protein
MAAVHNKCAGTGPKFQSQAGIQGSEDTAGEEKMKHLPARRQNLRLKLPLEWPSRRTEAPNWQYIDASMPVLPCNRAQ